MAEKLVDIDLSVNINNSELVAHLVFTNKTDKSVFLDRLTICYDNKIQNNLFKILDKNNERVDYKGVMVKRDVSSEDFITVNAGESIESNISLNEVYKVNKGNKYIIQYYAYNPAYLDISELTKLESNKVEIVY
jgi:hypothetical protein